MTISATKSEINLRDRLSVLDSLEVRTRDILRALEAKADGQLLHRTIWKDLVAPLASAPIPSANNPVMTAFGPSGDRKEYAFDLNDYLFVQPFHVNHDIIPGALAYPHVHWTTNGTSTNSVKWQLEILRALGHQQAAFAAPMTLTVEQSPVGTAWQHMVAEVSDSDALPLYEPDELILITLKRITNGGTDNTDDVFGMTVDLHYQSNTVGTISKAPDFYR